MQNDLPVIFQGLPYSETARFFDKVSGVPFPLLGTIEVTLWKHGAVSPIITATLANTKLSAVNSAGGSFVFAFTSTDTAATGSGYGIIQVKRTTAPIAVIASYPVRLALEGEGYPSDNDGTVQVGLEEYNVLVTSSSPDHMHSSSQITDFPSAVDARVSVHASRTDNPHGVTKTQVGLGSVDNIAASALRDRATHTGTQAISTIANLQTEVLKGIGARALFADKPNLLGRKALILDLIGGGAAHISDSGGEYLGAIENIPGATFTRSSTARRRTGKRGAETVAANLPRYHHNKDGAPRGILFERASTNLLHYTSAMGNWIASGGSISGGFSDPDQSGTAFKYTENSANGTHIFYSIAFPVTASSTYSVSGFLKANGRTSSVVQIRNSATNAPTIQAVFDLVAKTGTYTNETTGSEVAGSLEEWGDGWFRFTLSGKINGGATNAFVLFYALDSAFQLNYLGNGVSGINVYGLQAEEGMPTSWIPTPSNAAVTRAADAHIIPVSGFNLAGGLSFFLKAVKPLDTVNLLVAFTLHDAGTKWIRCVFQSTSIYIGYYDGAVLYEIQNADVIPGQLQSFAASFDPVDGVIQMKTKGVSSPPPFTLPKTATFTPNRLSIGSFDGVAAWLGTTVESLTIYDGPTTASNLVNFTG
jgi:hypothetical protein